VLALRANGLWLRVDLERWGKGVGQILVLQVGDGVCALVFLRVGSGAHVGAKMGIWYLNVELRLLVVIWLCKKLVRTVR
jgi:hypothetical protein